VYTNQKRSILKDLSKILSNAATTEEQKQFFDSIKHNKEERKEALQLNNFVHVSTLGENKVPSNEKQKAFDEFWSHTQPKTEGFSFRTFLKYAAVTLVLLAAGTTVLLLSPTNSLVKTKSYSYTYSSEAASISNLVLTDGSKVWLNANTQLKITHYKNKVLVDLIGEAWFDVIHDENRAFIVQLGDVQIKDLGTKFNVRAYPHEKIFKTTLEHGEIEIIDANEGQLALMKPGERFAYNKHTKQYRIIKVDAAKASAWVDGKFVFTNQSLQKICNELGLWYNVEFKILDQNLAETKYSCVLKRSTTVSQVLDFLTVVSEVSYKIVPTEKGKDKVIIYKK